MHTRHRIAATALGLSVLGAPALALVAGGSAVAAPAPSSSAPSAPSLPTLQASAVPSGSPTVIGTATPLPARTTAPGLTPPSAVPGGGTGLDVPAGRVEVSRAGSGAGSATALGLGATGVLLLAAGTTVAVRRRS